MPKTASPLGLFGEAAHGGLLGETMLSAIKKSTQGTAVSSYRKMKILSSDWT